LDFDSVHVSVHSFLLLVGHFVWFFTSFRWLVFPFGWFFCRRVEDIRPFVVDLRPRVVVIRSVVMDLDPSVSFVRPFRLVVRPTCLDSRTSVSASWRRRSTLETGDEFLDPRRPDVRKRRWFIHPGVGVESPSVTTGCS
jgi:hypothetical protein